MIAPAQTTFVLIGAGGIAKAYVQAFASSDNCRLVGIADVNRDAAAALAAEAECPAFGDIESMCVELKPTAAIVCTPPSTHPQICTDVMDLGINVLCEKPLAISARDAERMIAAAQRNVVVFTMASKFRFVEDVQKAREIIQSGQLGDVILMDNTFAGHVDMTQRWNSRREVSGGGVLIDNGTHSVDILRFLLGTIVDLQVVEGRRVQDLEVEDTARLFARTESGAMGSIDLSWSMNKVQPHFISVYGSGGTLQVGWQESRYRREGDADWIVFGSGYDKVSAFRNQIVNFADAIRGDAELVITPLDALASVEVIETAYEALASEKWHSVPRRAADRSGSEAVVPG